jgi:hypothetical protein
MFDPRSRTLFPFNLILKQSSDTARQVFEIGR